MNIKVRPNYSLMKIFICLLYQNCSEENKKKCLAKSFTLCSFLRGKTMLASKKTIVIKRMILLDKKINIMRSEFIFNPHAMHFLKYATLLKLTLLHGCFSRFLNCTNATKSRNASHICGIFTLKKLCIRSFQRWI